MASALTTIVASAATTPFSIYHFSRFPTYGIVANLIAVPLTGVWIMPLGMLGLLLMPFGLDDPCFVLMGRGIEIIVASRRASPTCRARWCASPRPPIAALIVTVLGGLVALPLAHRLAPARPDRRRARARLLMLLERPPDLLIDARGEIVAVRLENGRLALSPWQRDRWITDGWLQLGWSGAGRALAGGGRRRAGRLALRRLGCVLSRDGHGSL